MTAPIIIVGGGLSGLAAGVKLAPHHPVLVLEQKARAGGRAYSFIDATTGGVIDNGQHVLLAGYDRTMDFLKRIGTKHLLDVQESPALHLHHPSKGFCTFSLPKLPSPLHLLSGILSTNLFSFSDKLKLLRAGISLSFPAENLANLTINQWLDRIGQSTETKRSFWEPLAISIMNEHIVTASAKVFVDALRLAFLKRRNNSSLALPHVGLSELYVDKAVSFIEQLGGIIRLNADVVALTIENNIVVAVTLRDGTSIEGSSVILALPHYRLAEVLPRGTINEEFLSTPSSPIVSVHLWFGNAFMPQDFIGLIDRRVQWIFNKGKTAAGLSHLSCVISAAYDAVEMTNEELVSLAIGDLQSVYDSVPSTPVHAVVIREKRATFSCTPLAEGLRPGHQTAIPNLFLAGDWTNTGLPATIEGAVLSGELCADLALASGS
ncbi:MAG: hydroxysqualene dehydroxylase HpnE [bacterium]